MWANPVCGWERGVVGGGGGWGAGEIPRPSENTKRLCACLECSIRPTYSTELLNEKVKLLSLMEIVFTKQAKNRSVYGI